MDNRWIFTLGFLAQLLFASRMLVQWLASEKARKVENPTLFWILGLSGALLFLLYGWLRNDFALILGQLIGYYVYVWNLGAKGVWQRLGRGKPWVVGLLLLLPVAAVASLIPRWPAVSATLFHNDAIPHPLLVYGAAAQLVFSTRFLYQALYSARRKTSLLPVGFWIISTVGAAMILVYGILRRDPVLILAQACGLFTYLRNLTLWKREQKA